MFHGLIKEPDLYEVEDYQAFINRCIEIKSEKEKKNNRRKDRLKKKIQEMVTEYEKKGMDLSEVEILEEIKNQLVQEKLKSGGK